MHQLNRDNVFFRCFTNRDNDGWDDRKDDGRLALAGLVARLWPSPRLCYLAFYRQFYNCRCVPDTVTHAFYSEFKVGSEIIF